MCKAAFFAAIVFASFLPLHSTHAQGARPQFRPALLGSGPASLINRIDAAGLQKAGQKDGAVMFCAMAVKDGRLQQGRTYRAMPGSTALEQEVMKQMAEAKIVPAIYNYQPVDVLFYGTVVFSIVNGRPQVRIFLHQDPVELKKESDLIGPQPVFGGESKFVGLRVPQTQAVVPVSAVVDLGLKIDANGNPLEMRIIREEPPLLGFGDAALQDLAGAKFIPCFRDGDRTECETVLPVFYGTDA